MGLCRAPATWSESDFHGLVPSRWHLEVYLLCNRCRSLSLGLWFMVSSEVVKLERRSLFTPLKTIGPQVLMNLFNNVNGAPTLRYSSFLLNLLLIYLLITDAFGFPSCARNLLGSRNQGVFRNGEDASSFLGRRLQYNQFDLEMFVMGNLERECYEEQCNYEEAREIFEDDKSVAEFWKGYSNQMPKEGTEIKIDVIGLLTGLICAGTLLVIFGLLGYYWYTVYCYPRRHIQIPEEDHDCRTTSIRSRTQESFPLQNTVSSSTENGPPSYAQAVAMDAAYDVPPPPYPGTEIDPKLYRKALSIPASQGL